MRRATQFPSDQEGFIGETEGEVVGHPSVPAMLPEGPLVKAISGEQHNLPAASGATWQASRAALGIRQGQFKLLTKF